MSIDERSKYEAVFYCGFCQKQSSLSDDVVEKALGSKPYGHGESMITLFCGVCPCGHHSFNSTFTARFPVELQEWRLLFGTAR